QQAIRAELSRFRDEPVTDAELCVARNELIAGLLRSRETVEDRAFAFGEALMMTGDPAVADREVAAIQAVTAADIQRVARQYLTPDRAISARYLPEDAANLASTAATGVTAP